MDRYSFGNRITEQGSRRNEFNGEIFLPDPGDCDSHQPKRKLYHPHEGRRPAAIKYTRQFFQQILQQEIGQPPEIRTDRTFSHPTHCIVQRISRLHRPPWSRHTRLPENHSRRAQNIHPSESSRILRSKGFQLPAEKNALLIMMLRDEQYPAFRPLLNQCFLQQREYRAHSAARRNKYTLWGGFKRKPSRRLQ